MIIWAQPTLGVASFVCFVAFVLRGFWTRRPANQMVASWELELRSSPSQCRLRISGAREVRYESRDEKASMGGNGSHDDPLSGRYRCRANRERRMAQL